MAPWYAGGRLTESERAVVRFQLATGGVGTANIARYERLD
jgi:hypothetical protein